MTSQYENTGETRAMGELLHDSRARKLARLETVEYELRRIDVKLDDFANNDGAVQYEKRLLELEERGLRDESDQLLRELDAIDQIAESESCRKGRK